MNKTTMPPVSNMIRLFKSMWRQSSRMSSCPITPDLNGKLMVVTGGNAGIGLEVTRGLANRGATVVIFARNATTAKDAIATIQAETGSPIYFIPMDLADLESVRAATRAFAGQWPERTIDGLIANAGVWPQAYAQSAQGFEVAFGVNVLGHHAFIRRLFELSKLAAGSRIVMVTGDIYILAGECTPDFTYKRKRGGQIAYCRSKLGNLWWVREWARRHKDIEAYAVHPGVVASDLGGEMGGMANWLKRQLLLSTALGAQTSLFCATQPDLVPGGYYHNVMGRMALRGSDPAADSKKSATFWDTLEAIYAQFFDVSG